MIFGSWKSPRIIACPTTARDLWVPREDVVTRPPQAPEIAGICAVGVAITAFKSLRSTIVPASFIGAAG